MVYVSAVLTATPTFSALLVSLCSSLSLLLLLLRLSSSFSSSSLEELCRRRRSERVDIEQEGGRDEGRWEEEKERGQSEEEE